ncbi:conjugal transfer pilus assembly protein TraI (plasmid) [Pararobbsia alpina]|uniref:TraI domain-containing protein n=1 Tax=Pararobbsia alpina TaxID=621374 RepID=UPI0039A4C510
MSVPSEHRGAPAFELLSEHHKRIELIKQTANEGKQEDFDRRWYSVLTRCADWFSTMPLRPDQHAEPGGAFRATVELAYYAMRLAGGQKFGADLPSEKRRRAEPQYIYALFLASVCSWLDEPYRHFRFSRVSDPFEWSPAAHGPFAVWLAGDSYRVYRRDVALPVERMRTAVLAQTVVGSQLLGDLDGPILTELFGAINPEVTPQGTESLVHKVVRNAMGVAQEFERKAVHRNFSPVKFEVPSAVQVALAVEPVIVQTSVSAPDGAIAPISGVDVARNATGANDVQRTAATIDVAQSTLPFDEAASPSPAPTVAPAGPVVTAAQIAASKSLAPIETGKAEFDRVLAGAPNMLRDFFRALAEDVEAGKAKVEWHGTALVLSKKIVGSYGVTADTLVNILKQQSLLFKGQGADIFLTEAAGNLILPR